MTGYAAREIVRDRRTGRILAHNWVIFETPQMAAEARHRQPELFESVEVARTKPRGRCPKTNGSSDPRFQRNTPQSGVQLVGFPEVENREVGNRPLITTTEKNTEEMNNVVVARGDDTAVVVPLLRGEGFEPADALKLSLDYTEEQVRGAIRYVDGMKRVKNRRGYIAKALRNGWSGASSADPAIGGHGVVLLRRSEVGCDSEQQSRRRKRRVTARWRRTPSMRRWSWTVTA
jgi:hypothetical protein